MGNLIWWKEIILGKITNINILFVVVFLLSIMVKNTNNIVRIRVQ